MLLQLPVFVAFQLLAISKKLKAIYQSSMIREAEIPDFLEKSGI